MNNFYKLFMFGDADVSGLTFLRVSRLFPPRTTPTRSFAAKHAAAAQDDRCLRYVLRIDGVSARVALQAEPRASPLCSTRGPENVFAVTTRWYDGAPLVVRGAGAGIAVTASGVLADMIELGHAF